MDILFAVISGIIKLCLTLLIDYHLWLVVVAWLGYGIFQNTRKQKFISETDFTLLLIEVPKDNEKQELSAEQMFASLHGILRPRQELVREGSIQEHISFEIVSTNSQIRFYVWTPKHLKNFVEGQVYAQYPTVNISEASQDYSKQEIGDRFIQVNELSLTNNDVLPIRTFNSFEVDPLAGITAVLAKLEEPGEQAWIQILARPIDDSWHKRGENYIKRIRDGKGSGATANDVAEFIIDILRSFAIALVKPPESADSGKTDISDQQKTLIQDTNEKITKLGYDVKIRLTHIGPDKNLTRLRIQSLVGAFKQFNDSNQGFKTNRIYTDEEALQRYRARLFTDKGFILNIEELASLYHLPHKNVETPSMVWATSKTAEPPANLPNVNASPPEALSPIGATNFRGHNTQFGLKRSDRGRHTYIVGQTGTGKSFFMQLLTLSDIYYDVGFAIIDPHGDLATSVLRYIPEDKLDKVIYFNPADTDFPIAFNPLEVTDPALKNHISSEVVGALKRMFGYSWGPRLEYILRYTILALLDTPDTTLLGITRMLTDKKYRKEIVDNVQDPVVRSFWLNEFASWNEKFASEAVSPILNKVGAFTANPLIRNVIGQPKSGMDIRKIMDEGKILIINLSRGQVGEDNAATLGALMVTKIQLAAMSRADIPNLEDRRPFNLYVDEFQNFATESFAVILSEARKYGLNLTIANQYVAQMVQEVRDAVFGNVGTMVMFRVSADDAQYLAKYVAPTFEGQDLINLNNQHFIISMSIDGEKMPPFTATSLIVPPAQENHLDKIIAISRERYASPRETIEKEIASWADFDRYEQNTNNSGKSNRRDNRSSKPAGRSLNRSEGSDNRKQNNRQRSQSNSHQQRRDQNEKSNQSSNKTDDSELRPEQEIRLR